MTGRAGVGRAGAGWAGADGGWRNAVRWAALLAPVLLAGCASPSPELYSLEVRPGAVRGEPGRPGPGKDARRVVVVRGAALPRYLDRIEVVRAAGGARLRVAENEWWGEPLRAMLRRVLVADLAQRLPGADVLADDGPAAARPDAEVELEVGRFEPDGAAPGGPVVLEGYVSITVSGTVSGTIPGTGPGRRRLLDRLRVVAPVAGGTAAAQVDAMSAALGQAADLAASRLSR